MSEGADGNVLKDSWNLEAINFIFFSELFFTTHFPLFLIYIVIRLPDNIRKIGRRCVDFFNNVPSMKAKYQVLKRGKLPKLVEKVPEQLKIWGEG